MFLICCSMGRKEPNMSEKESKDEIVTSIE